MVFYEEALFLQMVSNGIRPNMVTFAVILLGNGGEALHALVEIRA